MSYEGEVLDQSATTWRYAMSLPAIEKRVADELIAGGKRSGLTLRIGLMAGRTALLMDCERRTRHVLRRRHTLFTTWLQPRYEALDDTEDDFKRLARLLDEHGLPLPTQIDSEPIP